MTSSFEIRRELGIEHFLSLINDSKEAQAITVEIEETAT